MKGRRKPLALSAAGRFVIDVLAGRPVRVPDDVSVDFWSEVSDICFRHGAHRIVAHRLTAAGEAVPADARRELVIELEQDQPRGEACLMAAVRQLVETGQALDSARIPFMPMKGIVLVHTIYGNEPLLRVFGDIDILVPEDRYDETISCLTEHSYTLAPHKRDTAALRNYGHKLTFFPSTPAYCDLDVHFRPVGKKLFGPAAALDASEFWHAPDTCRIGGTTFHVPRKECCLLYLLVHLSVQHQLASLAWLYDIKRFVEFHKDLDWDAFIALATKTRTKRACWIGLLAARSILESDVPEQVMKTLAPARLGFVGRCWFAALLNRVNLVERVHHYRQKQLLGKISRMVFEVFFIDDSARRRCAAVNWLFPKPGFLRVSYRARHGWQLAAYYLLHPLFVLVMPIAIAVVTMKYARERVQMSAEIDLGGA